MQAPPGVSMLLCVAMKHLEELKAGDEAIAKVSIMYRQIEAPLPSPSPFYWFHST